MKKIEKYFEKQLERTIGWVSFAEAKNGALIALNVAIMAFIIDVTKTFQVFNTLLLIFFVISSMLCVFSFVPYTKNRPDQKKQKKNTENLMFYGDIAEFESVESYIDKILDDYFSRKSNKYRNNKLIYDLASEVLINSRIAMRKNTLFKCAAKIDLIAFFVLIALLIIA